MAERVDDGEGMQLVKGRVVMKSGRRPRFARRLRAHHHVRE